MAEYISREFMLKNLEADKMNNAEHCEPVTIQIMERFIRYVSEFPAADVQPVKHGHWYHNTSKYISELDAYFIQACCSCCGKYSDRVDSYSQQMSNECCSHCGARMDGGAE
jgi:hypothetical protein